MSSMKRRLILMKIEYRSKIIKSLVPNNHNMINVIAVDTYPELRGCLSLVGENTISQYS